MADVKFEVLKIGVTSGSPAATIDATISGFGVPDAVLVFTEFTLTAGGQRAGATHGIGFASNTSPIQQRCCAGMSTGNTTASNSSRYHSTTSIARHQSASGATVFGEFAVVDFITDGVRLQEVTGTGAFLTLFIVLIGGTDVANVHVDNVALTNGTSPAITDVTAPGFEPDLVFAISHGNASVDTFLTSNVLGFGAALNDGVDTQKCLQILEQDAQSGGAARTILRNDAIVSHISNTPSIGEFQRVVIQDFDASGFSFFQETGDQPYAVSYMALRFTNNPGLALVDFEWPTTGDLQITEAGFEPDFALLSTLFGPINRNEYTSIRGFGFSQTAVDSQVTSPLGGSIWTASGSAQTNVTNLRGYSEWRNSGYAVSAESDTLAESSSYTFTSFGLDVALSPNPPLPVAGFALLVGPTAATSPIPQPSPLPAGSLGAVFENNTIISASPFTFDESPVISSPADVSYIWSANLTRIKNNSFLYDAAIGGHALKLTTLGQYNFVGNKFTGKWLDGTSPDGNGTPDAAFYNEIGPVILDITGGGDTPTFLDKQSPGTTINNNVSVTITNLQPLTEVRVYLAEDFTSPIDIAQLGGVEDTGSPSEFTFTAAAGTIVDIVIHNVDYVLPPSNRIKNFTVPTTDTSFPVSQIPDRNRI
jgi:hypothetical protein